MRLMRIVHAREAAKLEVVLASDNEYSLEQFKTCGHMRVTHARELTTTRVNTGGKYGLWWTELLCRITQFGRADGLSTRHFTSLKQVRINPKALPKEIARTRICPCHRVATVQVETKSLNIH